MTGSKIAAMKKIADDTDRHGGSYFPRFMRDNMIAWKREGLIEIESLDTESQRAIITAFGRKLAKKAMV